ncbi:MAG: sigma 54-interacting transcriptional regulator [Polyangiaceae bacterium]
MDTLLGLVRSFTSAPTFEVASDLALRASLALADRALAASGFAGNGRVLRAMVHLRPDDGYVRLVTLENGPDARSGCRIGGSPGAYLPSATAWRWLRQRKASVALDVTLQTVTVMESGAEPEASSGEEVDLGQSRMKLEGREVTHLLAVPLRAEAGRIEGMIAIEAACNDAIGGGFVWEACCPEIETLATLATPFLSKLPVSEISPTAPDELLPIIGASMAGLIEMVRVFSQQEETILLTGPTGAGKSRLARWCHARSPRSAEPFEELDLSRSPEDLQMGDLFGWRKGAFTSAARDTLGAVARADRGTLFIDEIDKLSLKAQAGLLRLLENKRYRPLGEGASDRTANARYIIGTNADLQSLVQRGLFREDLYYRINVLPVRLPPLRSRADEIIPWARYMLRRRHESGGGVGEPVLESDAAEALRRQDWPGNLRQLDNIIRRAYVLSLVDVGGSIERVRISLNHVVLALSYEAQGTSRGVLHLMELAAEAFAAAVEERADGKALNLDHAEGFKGMVIDAARRRFPGDENESIRKAFILLGKQDSVSSRNHLGIHRREVEKLDKTRQAFSGAAAKEGEGS